MKNITYFSRLSTSADPSISKLVILVIIYDYEEKISKNQLENGKKS